MAQGNHARPFGVNLEGLKRRGFDKPTMHTIRNIYKMLYRGGKTLEEVLPEIEQIAETDSAISFLLNFSNVQLAELFVNKTSSFSTALCIPKCGYFLG